MAGRSRTTSSAWTYDAAIGGYVRKARPPGRQRERGQRDAAATTAAATAHGPTRTWPITSTRRGSSSSPGKLGMWIFLATEILLFGGLFCAYAVYRANHPEIFVYAHQFLDKTLGAHQHRWC